MFIVVGDLIGHVSDDPPYRKLAVALSIFVFGGIEVAVHGVTAMLEFGPLSGALIDGALVGSSFGLAVWVLLVGNYERRSQIRQELERIAELNHEIRNALQVITDCHFDAEMRHRDMVAESVQRIDMVLRRMSPAVRN